MPIEFEEEDDDDAEEEEEEERDKPRTSSRMAEGRQSPSQAMEASSSGGVQLGMRIWATPFSRFGTISKL